MPGDETVFHRLASSTVQISWVLFLFPLKSLLEDGNTLSLGLFVVFSTFASCIYLERAFVYL